MALCVARCCFSPPGIAAFARECWRVEPVHQLIDEAYAELNSAALRSRVKPTRLRQHCNPMKSSLMECLQPDWSTVFANPELPLAVDIGSGQGRFALLMAKRNAGSTNYLGLDVRQKHVDKANIWAKELNLDNIHFITTNATFTFGSLMSSYPGELSMVCILCPDPHFKKRLHKRRIVQPRLVEAILEHIAVGGKIFLESDVDEVAVDMRNHFEQHLGTRLVPDNGAVSNSGACWLADNPVGIYTEREIAVLARGGKVYRLLYRRI